MKCRKCGEKAVIHMSQHKLALCKQHYLDWVPEQVEHAIKKYQMFTRHERVLVAVSGGKDSLSLWDILWRLGYSADGLYIGLGIDEGIAYSDESQVAAEKFAVQRGLNLLVFSVPGEYGASVPEIADLSLRGRKKPCAVCGMTKRHIMNRIAYQQDYSVLATGHNLDDEASVLLGNTINWLPGHLVRQRPVLEANYPGLARKVKPLCRMYEREMAAYALLGEISYIYSECPFAYGSKTIYYKEILNKLEFDRPGAKLNFYLAFLQAKDAGLFAPQADPEAQFLHSCPNCGQPTTAPGICAFCRMLERVK